MKRASHVALHSDRRAVEVEAYWEGGRIGRCRGRGRGRGRGRDIGIGIGVGVAVVVAVPTERPFSGGTRCTACIHTVYVGTGGLAD